MDEIIREVRADLKQRAELNLPELNSPGRNQLVEAEFENEMCSFRFGGKAV